MNVAWYTQDSTDTIVQYGPTEALGSSVAGGSRQYLRNHGYHHSATITGLRENAKYFYSVGDGTTRSAVYSFRTAPVSDTNISFSVNIFGDMGYLGTAERPMSKIIGGIGGLKKDWDATGSRRTMELLKDRGEFDWVWHVGDISYADDAFGHKDCLVGFCYEKAYNGFMNWVQNISAVMPYMTLPGNHESECHSPLCVSDPELRKALGNFTAYNTRFHMPSAQSGGRASMWYSFDYGPVHFVGINTETDFKGAAEANRGDGLVTKCGHFGADGEYIAWLEQDLKRASTTGKWIIAGGHRPWATGRFGGATTLMEKYGVDMYFAGHGHSYARGRSASNITTVMVGGAGCDEKSDIELDETSVLEWAHADKSGGFKTMITSTGFLSVTPTQLQWRLLESSTQKVLDTVTLTRKAP
eukprot:TRINITY_DN27551_c0_g1_i2.p1 TRINITY_DN27551_c0_g1~~TRINITY_DN27551_c0_g1_i2.p1  ORF type:complete len:471 (+),score=150.90 TRINITY_DN27551_c0_g1_i2:176-1414(+)